MTSPTLADIREALQRIKPFASQTPIMRCQTLDQLAGCSLFFKCENFQKVGAFKFRGACNTVFSLSEAEASRGVVTHSSGNHAAALALASQRRKIPAYIVMPENAPAVKKEAVKGYGGKITFCKPTLQDRETTTEQIRSETGATLVHPYNDYRIIAGQATCALELLQELSDIDAIVAPVGGGGLLSGTALCTKALDPDCRVIGAEPLQADDAYKSWKTKTLHPSTNPETIADGLRTSLGSLTFPIICNTVDSIIRVDEEEIIRAMRLVWERMKIVIEPSSAVAVAAVLFHDFQKKGRVAIILSGGNVDLGKLPF